MSTATETATTTIPRLKQKYNDEVKGALKTDLGLPNVMQVPRMEKIVVEGVNLAKKHQRKQRQTMQAGIIEKAMPLEVSNVMLLSPSDGKPTRVGYRFTPDGEKVRICKRTGVDIDG